MQPMAVSLSPWIVDAAPAAAASRLQLQVVRDLIPLVLTPVRAKNQNVNLDIVLALYFVQQPHLTLFARDGAVEPLDAIDRPRTLQRQ